MIRLRMTTALLEEMLADLRRPHPFAFERIGFLCCRQSKVPSGYLLLGYRHVAIDDDRYIRDKSVGARFDATAIRTGMQLALTEDATIFHVHLHEHAGMPHMSRVDTREMQQLMPCFVNVCPERLHGSLVLSADRAYARVWGTALETSGIDVSRITSVGDGVKVLS
jgi:hypothetical protein